MSTPNTKYAVDLSNDGVSLWHRDNGASWQLLGNVALSALNFSNDIENLKLGHTPDTKGKFLAQIRIPHSEVFVSEIDIDGAKGDAASAKITEFLEKNTPYSADEIIYDLAETKDKNKTYVAAIAKKTIAEAKDFISGYGFVAVFYTTKLDKADFPRKPRFYDGDRPIQTVAPIVEKVDEDKVEATPADSAQSPPPLRTTKEVDRTKDTKVDKSADTSAEKTVDTDTVPNEQLDAASTADLSDFVTVRSKTLTAPNKTGNKIEPTIATMPPAPPRRISIDIPKPKNENKPKPTAPVKGSISTPQGKTTQSDVSSIFRPRNILLFIALAMMALLYWLYTSLLDGKEAIAQLQDLPATEPAIIAELQPLGYQASTEAAPNLGLLASKETTGIPNQKTPKSLANPEPVIDVENIENAVASLDPPTDSAAALDESSAGQEQQITNEQVAATLEGLSEPSQPAVTEAPQTTVQQEIAMLVPTKNGTLGAEGITLFAGQPEFLPNMRSPEFEKDHLTETPPDPDAQADDTATPEDETPDLLALADPSLQNLPPKPRPAFIAGIAKNLQNSLLAKADPALAGIKPKRRPSNLVVPSKVTEQAPVDPSEIEVAIQQAVQNVIRPKTRPRNLNTALAKTQNDTAAVQTVSLGTSTANNPSAVGIQEEATERTGFNKRRISLVGVYGTSSNRRALVRMPSGRYQKIKPGQNVGGWKVSAIGESSVRITKGSRNRVLRMPR